MKNIFAITIITLISIAGNAQAADINSYILQKQQDAARTAVKSQYVVDKLRSLPEGVAYVVNTSVAVQTGETARSAPTAAELNVIAAASGAKRVAAQKAAQ